ncbi:MAG: tetratricopeptide repeat protein [Gammaproteobacteria bacterium]|nr:tetratricopeptide repeat protein [Gammaproteobacteria bacterium]MDX5374165.1 tetratricopeptide repeat protein [Gammaproteobacteria bacterium]
MSRRLPLFFILTLFLAGCAGMQSSPEAPVAGSDATDARSELMYRILVGEVAGQRGDYDAAVAYYTEAAEQSDDPRIAERATHVGVFAGQYDVAQRAARRWAALAPQDMEAQQFAAMLTIRTGDADAAVPYLESVLSLAGESVEEGFAVVAQLLAREGQPELAARAMGLLVERHPDVATAHHGLAVLALSAEDFDTAYRAAGQALELNPDLIEARIVRARALLGLGRVDEALASVEAMLEEMPRHHELRLNYARMLLDQQRYDEALRQFERVAEARPGDGDLLFTIGLLNIEAKRYDVAEGYLRRALKAGRHVNQAHYYLGRIAEQREEYKQGIAWYLKVTDGEHHFEAQTRIAVLFARLGHPDKAREHLDGLRERFPDEVSLIRLYLVEGQVLADTRAYAEAVSLYSEALTEFPGNPDLLYARALMAEKVDRLDLLESDLRAILARDPENATALNALGYTLADRTDRHEEALDYITRALEQRPDDPAVIDSMGWVQYRLGNLEAAERYLRQAHERMPDPEVSAHLIEVLWMRGERDEARQLFEQSLRAHPDSDPLRELQQRLGL